MAENRDLEHQRRLDLTNPEFRHETTDVDVWAVGKVGIVLLLVTIATLFVIFGVFRYFQIRESAIPTPAESGIGIDATKLPPQPRLQTAAVQDLREMHAAEDQILNSYGWVNQQQGIVKIPIDRAIDLLAQRGLPSRTQTAPETAAANVSVPTASSLGPKMQQPGGPLAPELSQPNPAANQNQ